MRTFPLYIFDLDGTVVRGRESVPFAADVLSSLRERSSLIRFVTNNSAMTGLEQCARLQSAGIVCSPDEFLTSAACAAMHCIEQGYHSAYVVGEPGLRSTIAAANIVIAESEQPDAIVVGICRSFDYKMLDRSMQVIKGGAIFIATNKDRTFPLEGGREQPGAGAIVAAIQECTGVEPLVMGKPETWMIETIMRQTGISVEDLCLVGDRIDTDIEAARRVGCAGVLVLTGVTRQASDGILAVPDLRGLLE